MLGSHHRVGHAEGGVRSGGEDPQGQPLRPVGAVAPVDDEVVLGPLRPTDPVALHGLDPLGPVQRVQVGQELVGVLGDAEEPLLEVALLHQVAGALARAVGQYLLIGKDGLAAGAPIDRGVGPVGQAGGQQFLEYHLVPAHVLGIVTADLAAPVVDGPERGDRLLQLGDSGIGEDPGMGAGLDGGVFGGQPEGVEPEGGEHRIPQHGAVSDQQIAERVVADMTHVGGTGRVGVHGEHVPGRAGIIGVHLVGAFVRPQALPLLLDLENVIGPCHGSRSYRGPVGPPMTETCASPPGRDDPGPRDRLRWPPCGCYVRQSARGWGISGRLPGPGSIGSGQLGSLR